MSGVKWGSVLSNLRRAEKDLNAGCVAPALRAITEARVHIETTLNEQQKAKRTRINDARRERLLAKMATKTGDTWTELVDCDPNK